MLRNVKRHEAKYIVLCFVLLGAATAWLLLTRPVHQMEGDFLAYEVSRDLTDGWVLERLDSTVATTRARACLTLARMADPAHLEYLHDAARDVSPRVRAMAAFAIGQVEAHWNRPGQARNEESAFALMGLLTDRERVVASSAAEALGKMRWRAAIVRLQRSAVPLPVTLNALALMGDRSVLPWIRGRLLSNDQDVRWAAVRALNDLGGPLEEETIPLLVNLQRDLKDRVRAEAARALARAPASEDVLEALRSLSGDRDPKVQFEAVRSLGVIGARNAEDDVLQAIESRNPNVVAAAAEALGSVGTPRVLPLLESLAKAPAPIGRKARQALARRAGAGAEPAGTLSELFRPAVQLPVEPAGSARRELPFQAEDYQRIARSLNRRLAVDTSLGRLAIVLDYEQAGVTAEGFSLLVEEGYFDGATFGEVLPNRWVSLANAGDSVPAFAFPMEINTRPFVRGSLGMLQRSGSGSGQFFICLTALPRLDGRYTNFGRVVWGDQLLDLITTETRIVSVAPGQ